MYMRHASITATMIYAHHVPKYDAAHALTRLVNGEADAPAELVSAGPVSF